MLSSNKLTVWVMTGMIGTTTVFFNLYILLTSLRKYRQQKQWSASETIITALALANMAHQLLCYLWMTMDEMDVGCHMPGLPYTLMLLLIFSFKFIIMWDTSFLTFYYSTKLVASSSRFWGRLREGVLAHVTPALLLIPVSGLSTCMPMMVVFHYDNHTSQEQDCGVLMPDTQPGKVYEVLYLLLADVVPGLVMIKCCVSISAHLAVHMRSMKASSNGAHGPKTGAELRVIHMALALVAVFLLFLVVDLYINYQIAVHHENAITVTFFFTSVYTTASALVLIYGKKPFWKELLHEYNACLDIFPGLSCLKAPEKKAQPAAAAADPPKIKS